jgi:hypothetical protein
MLQDFSREFAAIVPTVVYTGICDWLCDIQAPDMQSGPSGAPSNNWVALPGLTGIQCSAPPQSTSRVLAGEQKALEEIISTSPKHVWLAGYYPGIAAQRMLSEVRMVLYQDDQTVDAGIPHEVMGAESDSQRLSTRCEVRTVTV